MNPGVEGSVKNRGEPLSRCECKNRAALMQQHEGGDELLGIRWSIQATVEQSRARGVGCCTVIY